MEESTQEKPAPDDGKALEWLESPEGRRFTLLQGEGLICPCCFDELTAPLDIEQGICRDCWLMALEAERKAEIETRGFRCTCGNELLAALEREQGICQACITAYAEAHPLPDGPVTASDENLPF